MEVSRQLRSYLRIFQHFMEPEGSLPCSKGPSTEPDRSVHTTPSYLFKIHSNIILPPTSRSTTTTRFRKLSPSVIYSQTVIVISSTKKKVVLDLDAQVSLVSYSWASEPRRLHHILCRQPYGWKVLGLQRGIPYEVSRTVHRLTELLPNHWQHRRILYHNYIFK
jgi:hypothetical protein